MWTIGMTTMQVEIGDQKVTKEVYVLDHADLMPVLGDDFMEMEGVEGILTKGRGKRFLKYRGKEYPLIHGDHTEGNLRLMRI